ncbi:hypothetical protein SCLCIDRAFT_130003 [Scleroderma citrinum Foug A]|uniref:Uncharacterized protein n=1 Tax=Scleroderma citrinum Foug A TaxID=1036808 RepID=A0A0C3DN21_9AGAM|nr:hypothetical protein SCLCIDRAFT_130003 [Scleroderma citrinum Foug A]
MQGLPPKPDFPARPPAQTSDDRRASGGRSSPDRYVPRDDWRDRDQRSYRPRDPPRSPPSRARPTSPRQRSPSPSRYPREPKKPTQPYLPVIPRYNPGPPFSKALLVGADYDRFDAYRVHVASEQCKAGKAWRRAVHELEMATLELKTAQSRRELAEGLRKRAHAGLLGIGATTPGDAVSV